MYDVSVVILTFRRPHLVKKTISSVAEQSNASKLTYEIIVVDNCPEKSAEDTVARMTARYEFPIHYVSEPRQNIALARNAGIDHSVAEFVAMIDDDEQAPPDWLDHLYTTMREFDADAVVGPTTPVFEKEPPPWLGESNLFDRRRDIPTGTVIDRGGSGNVLMRSATCLADNNRFHPELGRSGGSDTDFFMRLAKRMGRKIVWCNEAEVEEFVPESRVAVRYLLRRRLRNNQALVWCSVRNSDHPIRTAAYLMFVVGCTQIAIWIIPSVVSAPFQTAYSVRAWANLMRGLGKLFWGRIFRFNFY
jgi:glycosyltransferase involved in cell wall biosynthesis